MTIREYIGVLLESVPQTFFEGAASILIVSLAVSLAFRGWRKGMRYAAVVVLVEYIALLYGSTVIFREAREQRTYDFSPFWSYLAISEGRTELAAENLMNVLVFVPVGFLLSACFKSLSWWMVLLIGCCLSLSIEAMQFLLMRGFAEFDDVMHNTLGCVMGYGVYKLSFGKLKCNAGKMR